MDVPVPADAPVTFVWLAVQPNVVAPRLLLSTMPVADPLQSVCVDGVAVTTGSGFTVMVTSTGDAEAHPLAEGVIVYTAVPGAAAVVESVCVMVEPLPAEAPLTPDCATVQLNVVPLTLLVREMLVAVPEQIVAPTGVAVTFGVGFTVTVTGGMVEVQPAGVVAVML